MKQTWKKYLLYGSAVIVGVALILAGYRAAWTGFGDYFSSNGDFIRGKTLWDWMELLVIPLVLAGGAFYLNRSERAVERKAAEDRANLERELATDRQQEAALQAYLDRMAELLLKESLRTTENEEVRNVARTRTLTVLRGLDGTRKGLVVRFLHEAKLITETTVVSLASANLIGANLTGANLEGAILRHTNLTGAILMEANLMQAILEGAILEGAILRVASLDRIDLIGAYLRRADLAQANLREANLRGANLGGAILEGGYLKGADLRRAKLERAILRRANLWGAYLGGAILEGADLRGANLEGANLERAELREANLGGAYLGGAILEGANLERAKVTDDQLATAKSITGATMPDGTRHD